MTRGSWQAHMTLTWYVVCGSITVKILSAISSVVLQVAMLVHYAVHVGIKGVGNTMYV